MTNVTLHVTTPPTRLHAQISSADLNVKLGPTSLAAKSFSIPDYVALISPTDVSNLRLWLDPGQVNTMYTDTSGTLEVAASDDPVGYATDKSLNQDAVAASDSTRPTYKNVFQGKYLYHDRVDDQLTVPSFPAADYTAVAAYYGGAQLWEFTHAGGTLDLDFGDYYELVVYTGTVSASDQASLITYMERNLPATPANEIWRFWTSDATPSLNITGASGVSWQSGDMQIATGGTFSKTVTPPETISLRVTDPENISYLDFDGQGLFGTLPDFEDVNLGRDASSCWIYLYDNELTGAIPTFPAAFTKCYFHNNNFTGNVPDMSQCVDLEVAWFNNNNLTGYEGNGFHASVTSLSVYCQDNKLTQEAVDAMLSDCVDTGISNGFCYIDGTDNASPSTAGLADKATLVGRGWGVNTN